MQESVDHQSDQVMASIPPNLDKVYAEASQWVRMANAIIWQMATVFVPASVACVGLAMAYKPGKTFFAIASPTLFAVWLFVSRLYRHSAIDARNALIEIERIWGIPDSMASYTLQGQIGLRRFNLLRVQAFVLVCLVIFWGILWIYL